MNRKKEKKWYTAPLILSEYRSESQGIIADSFGYIGGGGYDDGDWD